MSVVHNGYIIDETIWFNDASERSGLDAQEAAPSKARPDPASARRDGIKWAGFLESPVQPQALIGR